MSSGPLVSVVIPVLNGESVIAESVASALGQTYRNIEVIVVDNGSTDETPSTVRCIAEQDRRVRLVDSGRSGVSHARNIGIDEAKGEYITFCDADDVMEATALAALLAQIGSADIAAGGMSFDSVDKRRHVVHTTTKRVNESVEACGEGLRGVFEHLWERNYLQSCCSKLYARQFLETSGVRFDEKLSSYEDLAFVLDLLSHGADFVAIPDLCYRYYAVPTGTNWSKYREDKTDQMASVAERLASFYRETLHENEMAGCAEHIIQLLIISINNAQMTPRGEAAVIASISDVFARKVFVDAAAQARSYPNGYSRLLVRLGVHRHYRAIALLAAMRNAIRSKHVAH